MVMLKRYQMLISKANRKQPLLLLSGLLLSFSLMAQKPFISSLDKLTGTVNEEVTISGLNFPTTNLVVRFGAAQATVVGVPTASLIVAQVPAGATYGPVSVTNMGGRVGLTGYSSQHFLMSYSGTTFNPANVDAQQQFQNGLSSQPFDLTAADFNNDGLVDIIMTNDKGSPSKADIYQNTSIPTAISFTQTSLGTPGTVPTRNADSGDLDGDGLPDLVMTQGNNGNTFFIYRNTSVVNISFGAATVIALPDIGENIRITRRPIISDLDGDGKPEIIVSNETDNTIYVYVNQSTGPGNVSFSTTPIELIATGSTVGISGLDVKDLNNDGFPEVVANPFISSPNVFVFRNTSSPGSIVMQPATLITAPSGLINSAIGDFDGDGWNDVAVLNINADAVLLFRNTTTQAGSAISLASPISVATNADAPIGLALGDLNGDGKLDLTVGHEQGTNPTLVNLINTTVGNALTFSLVNLSSTNTSRNVKIVDLNNDGRPDIAYTNNIITDAPGDLSVFKNNNCITPVVAPVGPLTVCTGSVIILEATLSEVPPMTYQWILDGTGDIGGATNSTYTVPTGAPGSEGYSVRMTDGITGTCSVTSAVVTVVVDAAPTLIPAIIGDSAPCVDTDFQLTTSEVEPAYLWTGPGGFSSTEQNPTLSNITANQAGTYSLQVEIAPNGCLSSISTTDITVQNLPQPLAVNTGDANFCVGKMVNLTTPNQTGFTYSWNKDGVAIAGETTTTLPVTAGGAYTALISDGTCTLESPAETLVAVAPPASSYTSVDAICVDLPVNFTATSTGVTGFTLAYNWAFDDAATTMAVIADPVFTYTSAGAFNAALTTSYVEVVNCSNASQKAITVQAIPAITIEAQDDAGTVLIAPFEKCPSDEVSLIVSGTFTNVTWTTSGETDPLSTETTFATATAATYTFTGTDAVGCVPTAEVNLNNFEGSGLTLSSSSTIDLDDVINLEENQERVDLSVTGGTDYSWEPAALFTDPTSAMVEILPFDINTVITVTGTDINDCVETVTVTIIDPFIAPRNAFSPNGDGMDDCWDIGNSSTLNGCTVIVFDSRGRRLLEVVSPFAEDCVWDGNFSGNLVPEGVYYYAMSCDDNQFNRSGSILLAR